MIYFTADLHLGHRHAFESQNRPFESVDVMNEMLIDNINQTTSSQDTLYILGDLSFRMPKTKAIELIKKIKCKKILIRGNHDLNYPEDLFSEIYDFKELKNVPVPISLMHYPMQSWPKSHYGSIQLHGHMHNKASYNIQNRENNIRRFDVGVDANDYKPVSLDQIYEFFNVDINTPMKSKDKMDKLNPTIVENVSRTKPITFGTLRKFICSWDSLSICMAETSQYQNFRYISDVPDTYDPFYLYGFGIIESEFYRDRDIGITESELYKGNEIFYSANGDKENLVFVHCIEIMLSKNPRTDV